MTPVVRVRRERAGDAVAARRVHDLAFGGGAAAPSWESRLVDELRGGAGWIPALSLVAEVDGRVVGHALATRAHLRPAGAAGAVRALGLAPVGVLPGFQHHGVGTRLVASLLGAAQALDETLVCLLGDPAYYRRFGFVPASTLGVSPPVPAWGTEFQALLLDTGTPVAPGTFHYDPAFDRAV